MGQRRARHRQDCLDVHCEHSFPFLLGSIGNGADQRQARIVHQDVQTTERRHYLFDRSARASFSWEISSLPPLHPFTMRSAAQSVSEGKTMFRFRYSMAIVALTAPSAAFVACGSGSSAGQGPSGSDASVQAPSEAGPDVATTVIEGGPDATAGGDDGALDTGAADAAGGFVGEVDACGSDCTGVCTRGRCLVTLASGQPIPQAIVVVGTTVYWSDRGTVTNAGTILNDGRIMKMPAVGGTPTTLASGLQQAQS